VLIVGDPVTYYSKSKLREVERELEEEEWKAEKEAAGKAKEDVEKKKPPKYQFDICNRLLKAPKPESNIQTTGLRPYAKP